ncbi:hypothetical protein GN956_G12551 [Arapaima gigas]
MWPRAHVPPPPKEQQSRRGGEYVDTASETESSVAGEGHLQPLAGRPRAPPLNTVTVTPRVSNKQPPAALCWFPSNSENTGSEDLSTH